MAIVQFYKGQVVVNSILYPVPPGGATLMWPKNYNAPAAAGNYWQVNYIEGLQTPAVDIRFGCLDGYTAGVQSCALRGAFLTAFMTRTSDYKHDVSALTNGLKFFDGYSGWTCPYVKCASFTIGGSKGDDVRFNAQYMIYDPSGVGTYGPSALAAAPITTPPGFTGSPVRFQACSFYKYPSGGETWNAWDGILSWDLTFSNNMTPDLSMVGVGPQSPLPIDCNAGMMTCSLRITQQASVPPPVSGDQFKVVIGQGVSGANLTIITGTLINQTPNDRGIGTGRQIRTYMCTVAGTSNVAPPITVS